MNIVSRRSVLRLIAFATTVLSAGALTPASAQERTSVKIGYALSLTGPNAGGTGITTLPN
jgi:branched-chain amino acid transport system substrate-binding protein